VTVQEFKRRINERHEARKAIKRLVLLMKKQAAENAVAKARCVYYSIYLVF
jgi:hypothetical protein